MVSIIVPVYNVEKYVERCVESILAQSYSEFELLLVDDGSTDQSGAICERLKAKDKRIRVIHQNNRGLSAARNRGLAEATGEYITYIDSDDYVDISYLETLYQNAIQYQADVSVCSFRLVRENKKKNEKIKGNGKVRLHSGRDAAEEIVAHNKRSMITAWGKLYHRSLKELLIYPEGRLHEDEFVTYKVLYEARQVVEADVPLYNYYQRGNSIINDGYSIRRLDKIVALKEAIDFFASKNETELMKQAIKRYVLSIQIAWYRVKKFMPDEKTVLSKLNEEWKAVYAQNKSDIMKRCSIVDKVAIIMYDISPASYSIVAHIMYQLLGNQ